MTDRAVLHERISSWFEPKPTRPEPKSLELMRDGLVFSPRGFWKHFFGKTEWLSVHDYHDDESANAMLLDKMLEARGWEWTVRLLRGQLLTANPFGKSRRIAVVHAFCKFARIERV